MSACEVFVILISSFRTCGKKAIFPAFSLATQRNHRYAAVRKRVRPSAWLYLFLVLRLSHTRGHNFVIHVGEKARIDEIDLGRWLRCEIVQLTPGTQCAEIRMESLIEFGTWGTAMKRLSLWALRLCSTAALHGQALDRRFCGSPGPQCQSFDQSNRKQL